jgi:hypothetical protein
LAGATVEDDGPGLGNGQRAAGEDGTDAFKVANRDLVVVRYARYR